jgi:quercetin dioxygenase-like cupin family protein
MKRIWIFMFVLLATGFVRSDARMSREQDPVSVNPGTTVMKLDNPRVRVLEVTLKPGAKEKTHSHPAYVVYIIEGGKVRNHASDGTVAEVEFKAGDVVYWAENIGNTTIRLVLVELKN